MRYILIFIFIIILVLTPIFFKTESKTSNQEYLRIHVRANSNSEVDQDIKYLIKDKVVEYMTPAIASCQTKQDAERVLKNNFYEMEQIANNILKMNNYSYKANVKLANEYFPTRSYGELTLNTGYYDALIIELGEAKGDNWWCVVYPPMCFLNTTNNCNEVVYKSKIMEIINKFFK